jgi:LysR family transcriptional regulator, glycine cleavage system transcriptional activator
MDKRRSPRLSLDLLRGFHAAARHLSFTRAAQELFLTQSAISRGIKSLEEQVGQPLFRRVHRALELTPAGQQLLKTTEEVFARINDTADRLINSGKVLSITTTTPLASLWLAPRLPRFSRLHPSIDVRIVASDDNLDLDREQLDIAIPLVPHGAPPPAGERFLDCALFPVCAPALARDAARPLRTAADLASHVWLDHETIRNGRPWSKWDFWIKATKNPPVTPRSMLWFSHADQMIAATLDGSGVAMGGRPHLTRHLQDGVLCAPLGPDAVAHVGSFFIVVRPDAAARNAVDAFVSWLRSEARRDNDLGLAVSRPKSRAARSPVNRASTRAS